MELPASWLARRAARDRGAGEGTQASGIERRGVGHSEKLRRVGGEREVFIDLEPGRRIRFRRSEPPPPISYAITLEILEGGRWTTVRLWDNADNVDEHHEHAHTREDGKQSPTILDFKSSNDAMAAAIRKAKAQAPEIVRRWSEEQ